MAPPLIDAQALTKAYAMGGQTVHALRGVSLQIDAGEFVAIMGASGSGKSTLLNCVSTIDSATSGHVFVRGVDVTSMRAGELARFRREQLGFIFQDSNLLDTLTARENIALPLRYHSPLSSAEIDELVETIIADLHLDYCRDMRPIHLKPSEILKTAYGRAIALDPSLVLIEHPLEGQCLINTATFLKQLFTGSPVNGPVNSSSSQETFIGGIDNSVHL